VSDSPPGSFAWQHLNAEY